MRLTTALAGLLGATLLAVLVLMPFSACGCSKGVPVCAANLKHMGIGMIAYAMDHDDRFPPRERWMDEIEPYVKEERTFHDLHVPKGAYGYAFDARRAGRKPPNDEAKAPLVYDSTKLGRNASDAFTSLPRPGRHDGKNGIVYADGHAKRVVANAPGSGGGAP